MRARLERGASSMRAAAGDERPALALEALERDRKRYLRPLAQRGRKHELLRGMGASAPGTETVDGQLDGRSEVACVAGAAPRLRDDRTSQARARALEQLRG